MVIDFNRRCGRSIMRFCTGSAVGRPSCFPHPVVWMGRAIGVLERFLRPRFPQTRCGQRAAGAVLAATLPVVRWR